MNFRNLCFCFKLKHSFPDTDKKELRQMDIALASDSKKLRYNVLNGVKVGFKSVIYLSYISL